MLCLEVGSRYTQPVSTSSYGLGNRSVNTACYSSGILTHVNALNSTWPLSRQREIPWRFPDGSWHSSAALGMLSVTLIMPVLVLLSVVEVGIEQYMI